MNIPLKEWLIQAFDKKGKIIFSELYQHHRISHAIIEDVLFYSGISEYDDYLTTYIRTLNDDEI